MAILGSKDMLHSVSRASSIFRMVVLVMTVGVNLSRLASADHPVALLVANVVMLVVTAADMLLALRTHQRSWLILGIDLALTTGLVVSSRWILGEDVLQASYLGVAAYWMVSAPLVLAIAKGVVPGVLAGGLLGLMGFFQIATPNPRSVLDLVCMVVAPAFAGLMAQQLGDLSAQRDRNHAVAAALSERERLSRIVHDGALQVLALVEREGKELGPRGRMLAAEARKQEERLRRLLQDKQVVDGDSLIDVSLIDLTDMLAAYRSDEVTVSTMADALQMDALRARELDAVISEVLLNVSKHAGDNAKAWILLEATGTDAIISVRDNGVGLAPQAIQEAAEAGRMGIQRSILGRINSLGGRAEVRSRPGRGVEWEFVIPIREQ